MIFTNLISLSKSYMSEFIFESIMDDVCQNGNYEYYCSIKLILTLILILVLDCPTWRFGPNCEQECHCADISEACDSILGICSSGCAQGWEGYNCQTRKSLAFFITFILHARNISVFYPETSEVSHSIIRTIF